MVQANSASYHAAEPSKEVSLLYLISWLTDFALILFVFAGTRYLAEREVSPMLLGMLGASFFLASAVSNACSGQLADRVGRRRVALCGSGLFLTSLATVASISPESPWFYAAYTFVGISVGLIYPPIMALLGHGKTGLASRRAYLWFCIAFNLGITSAQLTGGWLFQNLGARSPLLVAMGLTIVGFVTLLLLLKEPPRETLPPESHAVDRDGRLARAFARLIWVANFGGMFSMSMLWFLFPILVVDLGVEPSAHGVVLAVGRVVVMSTYCVMYLFPGWHYRFGLAAAAQALGAVGLIGISQGNTAWGLAGGVAALSAMMGYNYFAGLFYSARGNAPKKKGLAFGLNEASLGLGAAGGSFFGAIAVETLSSRAPFAIAASLVLTLIVVQTVAYWALVRPLRSPATTWRIVGHPSDA